MMLSIAAALRENGLTDDQIKFELFASGQPGRAKRPAASAAKAEHQGLTRVKVTLDGETRNFSMPKDTSVLEAAIAQDVDPPFACKAGVCSTCRARVIEGEVEMVQNHALEDGEVSRGYVLTCQCYPLTDTLVLTYDDH